MLSKKKFLAAVAVCCLAFASTCFAAPEKFSVQADEMDYDLATGKGSAKGHVVLVQGNSRATADAAVFNSKDKSGRLTGNVVADRGDARIVCQEFIAHNEDYVSAVGNASITRLGRSVSAGRIDYYQSREYAETIGGWARLNDTDGSVLQAGKIDYNIAAGVAKAYGGVTISSSARQLEASADSAVYETGANGYIELQGNAKATQNGNSVAGDKLRLTNANVAVADGNVKIIYLPQEQEAKA